MRLVLAKGRKRTCCWLLVGWSSRKLMSDSLVPSLLTPQQRKSQTPGCTATKWWRIHHPGSLMTNDLHGTHNVNKKYTWVLSLRFGFDYYRSITSLRWLIHSRIRGLPETSQSSQERLCLSLSLAPQAHSELGTSYSHLATWARAYLKRKAIRSKQRRKNSLSTSFESLNTFEHKSCLTLWISQWCEKDIPIFAKANLNCVSVLCNG